MSRKRRGSRYRCSRPKAKSRRYHRQGGWILLAEAVREEMERQQARRLQQLANAERRVETTGGFRGLIRPAQRVASAQIDHATVALEELEP